MRIIFLRHGQTEFNLEDRFQGVANSPLNGEGKALALTFNEILKHKFNIKKFYLSPALRVIQTFELVSKDIKNEHIIDPRLRECCYGNWDGKLRSEIRQTELVERQKDRFNYIYPGEFNGIKGESYAIVFERVKNFLDELLQSELSEGKEDICIISHNGVMMAIKKYFEKLNDQEMNSLRVSNEEYFVYDSKTHNLIINRIISI